VAEASRIIIYCYVDPAIAASLDRSSLSKLPYPIYDDLGSRLAFEQVLDLARSGQLDCILLRSLADLGDSMRSIAQRLQALAETDVTLRILQQPLAIDRDIHHDITGKSQSETPLQSEGATEFAPEDLERLGLEPSDLLINSSLSEFHPKTLLATIADYQALAQQQHQRRLQQGHARNRLAALPPPGRAPFGYRRGKDRYTIDRAAANIVKDFFEHFLLYGSLRGAVRFLDQKHHKQISVSTGRHWLTNPVYRGDLAYKTGEVILNTHPAIVSREEAAQVDRLLRRNRSLPPKTASAARSLAGLTACATCQSKLAITSARSRRSSAPGYLYLRPLNCQLAAGQTEKCPLANYDQILQQAITRICRELPDRVDRTKLPDLTSIKGQLQQAMDRKNDILNRIPDLEAQGIFDPISARLRTHQLRAEMGAIQEQISQLPPANLDAIARSVSIPEFWQDLSEAERRFYFREFLTKIWVAYRGQKWKVTGLDFVF
jgi:DNA invertase Pin-like site-specific DNA recombinase